MEQRAKVMGKSKVVAIAKVRKGSNKEVESNGTI